MSRVGFVGAGRMGMPMVERLLGAGHDVRVLGRSVESRAAIEAAGAKAVADVSEVGIDVDLVTVCVFTDAQVREVCFERGLLKAMPRGSALVVHTTISPKTIEDLVSVAEPLGIDVVDAAVSGGPHNIAAGNLALFVGGTEEAVGRIEPALKSYGTPLLHVGGSGSGLRVKLVNNALFAAQIGLLAEAEALGRQLGVAPETLFEALPHGSSACKIMGNVAMRGSVEAFRSSVGEFISKDVSVVRNTVAELGADLGVLDTAIDARA
ncbi:NAD(P)-dependent oxidoreductase [Rhodococcus sp. HNM0563]|uniref:NAD(P)-dependent oxidoreductase n=1 Tax=unclassified Rhodococcus (in: high G+C Gram-positive bacteria) TaxID=192944 RepID=UPI00146B8551|nr:MULTISPECIES: NAD(P)-dependent oxidoreductase [unclassified Rhodococcus (in: high G+C Gram-positive bacteria)]MCK0090790.1 NAD(P)-dependent oxidoreductase [Rhodococcus sp. F64268]NLU61983.1 NAD(P)-dependent oxidoreductase [Rhodococcus sp. HNM0563]